MIHRYFHTEMLSQRHVFTQAFTHTHAFTQGWFYTQIPSCAGVFTQGCFYIKKKIFYTQTRGHFYTQMSLHSDVFTEECFYTHVRLHGASFDTNELLHAEDFTLNTLTQTCSSHRKTFVQRRLFRHIHFYEEDFCTDTFTERCLYIQVLLH